MIIRKEPGVIVKRGAGVSDQGVYCQQLGAGVCPAIFAIGVDEYEMEELHEPSREILPYLLGATKSLLREKVWTKSARHNWYYDWKSDLCSFSLAHGVDISRWMDEYYPEPCSKIPQCRIHGDPTMANMLLRVESGVVDLVISDPIRPSGKIPGLPEVDMGKLLQSSLGWELSVLRMNLNYEPTDFTECIVGGEHPKTRIRSLFWCMIHFMRTLSYLERAVLRVEKETVLHFVRAIAEDIIE